jgi:hypothetical protein
LERGRKDGEEGGRLRPGRLATCRNYSFPGNERRNEWGNFCWSALENSKCRLQSVSDTPSAAKGMPDKK